MVLNLMTAMLSLSILPPIPVHTDSGVVATPNSFVLPDGRVIEVRSVLVRPHDSTYWGLSTLKTLPPNHVRM
jgi:hypothetical protein